MRTWIANDSSKYYTVAIRILDRRQLHRFFLLASRAADARQCGLAWCFRSPLPKTERPVTLALMAICDPRLHCFRSKIHIRKPFAVVFLMLKSPERGTHTGRKTAGCSRELQYP